jgi:hypothetical protein
MRTIVAPLPLLPEPADGVPPCRRIQLGVAGDALVRAVPATPWRQASRSQPSGTVVTVVLAGKLTRRGRPSPRRRSASRPAIRPRP